MFDSDGHINFNINALFRDKNAMSVKRKVATCQRNKIKLPPPPAPPLWKQRKSCY